MNHLKLTILGLLALFSAVAPAAAQDTEPEKSHILVYKTDGTIDTLLLNNVLDIYHSRQDTDGVMQKDVCTLRLRTVGSEVVYPLAEIDHLVMPKSRRVVNFSGSTVLTKDYRKHFTSVNGDMTGKAGTSVEYRWVNGDRIFLENGEASRQVSDLNGSDAAKNTTGNFSFVSDSIIADQYIVFYPGQKATRYNEVTIPTEQQQAKPNNSDHIGLDGDCGTAVATRQRNSDYSFSLDHKTAVICLMPRVDTLKTITLKQIAIKANRNIAGSYIMNAEGITLKNGTGNDSIALKTSNFLLPNVKATAQDSSASYIVVAPQQEKTTFKVYYRVYDTKSEIDTVVAKNVSIAKIEPSKVYPVTSLIPARMFMAVFTDSSKWEFGKPVTLYGSVNLPVSRTGFLWGYKKDLTFSSNEQNIPLTPDGSQRFTATPLDNVRKRAYYYRAYAKQGDHTWLGKVKKFGMEREIIYLGTSVAWSSINLGSVTAEDRGDYYAWGELKPKDSYTIDNYQYYKDGKYIDIGVSIAGNPKYDAVAATWRGCWRMPTRSELQELVNKTNRDRVTINGVDGYIFKNRNNNADSTMFVPMTGYYKNNLRENTQESHIWSAEKYNDNSAWYSLDYYGPNYTLYRYYGLAIRPVFESNVTTKSGVPFFIHTDSIRYSSDHTSTVMKGTMRGLDEDVKGVTEGFVIGTSDKVTLKSGGDVLQTTLSQEAPDNGSYSLPLSAADMDKLTLGQRYYVRAFMTYQDTTFYGQALTMDAMTITTDSTNWQVGMNTARLCGTATGITESVASTVELGFVVGTTADVTLKNGIELKSDSTGNGKFVSVLKDIDLRQYYYRAFIRQGGRVFYGNVRMLGLEMVDLGLPSGLRWANINMGSQAPTDNGSFYHWGETTPNTTGNYSLNNQDIGSDIAGTLYDAAQVNWQGPWRMPTSAEMQELLDNTTYEKTTLYGKSGYMLTSKHNGKKIFLPMTGWWQNGNYYDQNNRVLIWASNGNTSRSMSLDGYNNKLTVNDSYRYDGIIIRPVAMVTDTLSDKSMICMTTGDADWNVGDDEATLHGYILGLRYDSLATDGGIAFATRHITDKDTEEGSSDVRYIKRTEGEKKNVVSGAFTASVSDIKDGTIYYYRTFVKVDGKYYYAEEHEFGRRMVDLGLPSKTLWSNINLGAASPEQSGAYYAWGETQTKDSYAKDNYTSAKMPKDISGSSFDAAHVLLGGLWQMPARDDINELLTKCTWTEVVKQGHPLYRVVGPSGDSIFIAKSGYMQGSSVSGNGTRTSLWSSEMNNEYNVGNDNAFGTSFVGVTRTIESIGRYLGYSIRPVVKYNNTLADGTRILITTDSTNWQVGNARPVLYGRFAGIDRAKVKASGFVVATSPAEDKLVADNKEAVVVADTLTVDGRMAAAITYDKDTTYYYRAYILVDGTYYYGGIRRYGLELVDLGGGLKWASINIGSQTSSDYGTRLAWGETKAKSSYTRDSYSLYENGYEDIGSDINGKRYDAAKVLWGGTWHMPTVAEMRFLTDSCTWKAATVDGVSGYTITGKNGKSIFLPAAGRQDGTFYSGIGSETRYWTSSAYSDNANAYTISVSNGTPVLDGTERFYGLAIRPVTTAGTKEGGGGDITGSHNQGQSQQGSDDGAGTGGAGTGDTGGTIGD